MNKTINKDWQHDHINDLQENCSNSVASALELLGPVLLQRFDAVPILSANGSEAFKECCTPIG